MKKTLLMLTFIICVIIFPSCSSKKSIDENAGYREKVVRINDSMSYASCVQSIIRSKGYLEEYLPEDVSVEWTSIANSAEIRDAVAIGEVNLASVGAPSVIMAIENGVPIVLISATAGAPVYLYSNNPEINEFEDIGSDTRISIMTRGGASHISFLAKSKEVFGDALVYDNNLVSSPDPETLASVATSKDIDCAFFGPPSSIKADEIEHLRIIEDLTPIVLDYGITSYYVTNRSFYEDNPTLIEAFRKASEDAVEFINSNVGEAASILAEVYDIEARHLEDALTACPPSLEIDGYDAVAELLYEVGILEEEPKKLNEQLHYKDMPISTK